MNYKNINVHFIAVGGSVMHQLAIALKHKGYTVTGSDDEIFEPARTNLRNEHLLPQQLGWFPENIHVGINAIILGMHAKADNPELLAAQQSGIKIYSFPEFIYEESKNKTRIVVGGSHGKTTTTSMIMHVFKECNVLFDYLVGAALQGFEQSVRITDAPVIVCEGDEYPASTLEKRPKFHFLYPHVAIITGIAWDHINVFPTFDFYVEQFQIFIGKMEPGGLLIYNETDEVLNKLVNSHRRTGIRYQPYHTPQYTIEEGKTIININGETTVLQVFGQHNLLNLQAATYACAAYGISKQQFIQAIGSFTGAAKRLQLLSANSRVQVYRDFAHAPSKVKATIEAVKQQYPDKKLFAILELHTYSSLNEKFMHEYSGSMNEADTAVVFYSNHALELKRLPALPAEKVADGFKRKDITVFTDKEQLWQWLQQHLFDNASLLFMSSGNYDGLPIDSFAKQLTTQS